MNPSFSFWSKILRMDWVATRSDIQAHFKEIHKNRSHPKKLKLNIRSENKKYSEWSEKGSLGSNESCAKNELLDLNKGKKEETVRSNFSHCKEIGFKKSFSIHCFLLFIISFSAPNRVYLKYFYQVFFLFLGGEI